MSFIKSIFTDKDTSKGGNGDEYYDIEVEDAVTEEGSSKMILLEPRAYSEAQQIADHLKKRTTVVVNLKRVTADQAKRIMDFLSGTIYAIRGNIQKIRKSYASHNAGWQLYEPSTIFTAQACALTGGFNDCVLQPYG